MFSANIRKVLPLRIRTCDYNVGNRGLGGGKVATTTAEEGRKEWARVEEERKGGRGGRQCEFCPGRVREGRRPVRLPDR